MFTESSYQNDAAEQVNLSSLSEEKFDNILENVFAALVQGEKYSSQMILNGLEKQLHTHLLRITTDFVRHNTSQEDIEQVLPKSCNIAPSRLVKYISLYEKNKVNIQHALLNIGTFLPHITDVKWQMDYIVKSSMVEDSEGPLFRISLVTEKYDETDKSNKTENINFTCTSQELKDLVYKLKEAVKHCNSLSNKFN